jgi:hypothetical protein
MTKAEFNNFLDQLFKTATLTPKTRALIEQGRADVTPYNRLKLAGKILGAI